jgi:Spirocyclase AveC-like
MTDTSVKSPAPTADTPTRIAGPAGLATAWALLGSAWIAFVIYGTIRWFASGEAGPAPILGPDVYPTWQLVGLRGLEIVSMVFVVYMVAVYGVRPWRQRQGLTLEAMMLIGGLVGFFIDPLINFFRYAFAWNAHAINIGTWLSVFPGHVPSGPYAEGILWAFPQYIMMSAGAALSGYWMLTRLCARFPDLGLVRGLAVVFVAFFLGDMLIEGTFIFFGVYAYPRAYSGITLFAGTLHQFPLNESFFVAAQAVALTLFMRSARESDDGLSFVERGSERLPLRYRTTTRCLAVVGFTFVVYAFGYFFPWSWMSITPDSVVNVPSYMQPGPV